MRSPVAAGARVVVLDGAVAQIDAALSERGVSRFYKWGPSSLDPSDVAWQQGTFTAGCVGVGMDPGSFHVAPPCEHPATAATATNATSANLTRRPIIVVLPVESLPTRLRVCLGTTQG